MTNSYDVKCCLSFLGMKRVKVEYLSQCKMLLNHSCIHLESRTKIWQKPFVAGIGINQEKWVNFVVADIPAPRILTPSVVMVLNK